MFPWWVHHISPCFLPPISRSTESVSLRSESVPARSLKPPVDTGPQPGVEIGPAPLGPKSASVRSTTRPTEMIQMPEYDRNQYQEDWGYTFVLRKQAKRFSCTSTLLFLPFYINRYSPQIRLAIPVSANGPTCGNLLMQNEHSFGAVHPDKATPKMKWTELPKVLSMTTSLFISTINNHP